MKCVYDLNQVLKGKHVYRREDYAFDFLPASIEQLRCGIGDLGTASLTIHELQIEMDVETGRLVYVWGYCPWFSWIETDMPLDGPVVDGAVFALEHELDRGEARSIPPTQREQWRIMHNPSSGWVIAIAASTEDTGTDILVRITEGCILGLRGTDLTMLWIHAQVGGPSD
jgi:hypothetical protein